MEEARVVAEKLAGLRVYAVLKQSLLMKKWSELQHFLLKLPYLSAF